MGSRAARAQGSWGGLRDRSHALPSHLERLQAGGAPPQRLSLQASRTAAGVRCSTLDEAGGDLDGMPQAPLPGLCLRRVCGGGGVGVAGRGRGRYGGCQRLAGSCAIAGMQRRQPQQWSCRSGPQRSVGSAAAVRPSLGCAIYSQARGQDGCNQMGVCEKKTEGEAGSVTGLQLKAAAAPRVPRGGRRRGGAGAGRNNGNGASKARQ